MRFLTISLFIYLFSMEILLSVVIHLIEKFIPLHKLLLDRFI